MKLPAIPRRPLLAVLVVVALAAGIALRPHASVADAKVKTAAAMELDAADVAEARTEPIAATLTLSGLLQPLSESVLTAEVDGRIAAVLVRPGETVKAGQVLARMDTRDLAARLSEHEANLAAARVQFELAQKTQRRNEELQARQFVSTNSLDTSRSALDANREMLRAREAQLALARQALDKAVVRAPQSGVIADRAVQPGQHVGLNTRLFSIVDLAELEFAANVPVAQISAVQVGQNVAVAAEGVAGDARGRVERIAPTADVGTRMIPVYIRVANPDGSLRGGMAARGLLRRGEIGGAVTLPQEALRGSGEKPAVMVIAQGKAELREATTGVADEASGRIEIKSGIQPGEIAILARVRGVSPGQAVAVAKPATAAH